MKKLTAVLISALLLLSPVLGVAADAAEQTPDKKETVSISNAQQLIELSEKCVSDTWSKDKIFVLRNDINLTGLDFTPIPLMSGVFDGRGHSIIGVNFDAAGSSQGFIRCVLAGGEVKNLTVFGSFNATGYGENIGGVAGVNFGKVTDCNFDGDIQAVRAAGGVVGLNMESGTVSGCQARGTINGQHRIGGIAGENRGIVTDCQSAMLVNTEYKVTDSTTTGFDISSLSFAEEDIIDITDLGGIVGLNTADVSDCTNIGTIGYPHTGYNVGGIAGRQSGRITDCTNTGEITGRKDVGGIVGQLEPYSQWNYSGTGLAALQNELYQLEGSMQSVLQNLGAMQTQAALLMQEALGIVGDSNDIIGGMEQWPDFGDISGGIGGDTGGDDGTGDAGSTEGGDETGSGGTTWYDPNDADMEQLSGNMQQVVYLMQEMATVMGDEAVAYGLQDVVTHLMNASAAIVNIMYDLTDTLDKDPEVHDISADEADDEAKCLVARCENRAYISADTNVGGIAGNVALDIAFDREDQLQLTSVVLGNGQYEVLARISNCESYADVDASKSCAGGIAGRMDYGAMVQSSAAGDISAAEEYAGGVAGYCTGTLDGCCARVNLAATSYVGGIAGLGKNISNCRAMPHIENYAEYQGSVAGYADGTVQNNIYTDSSVGGVDGFSFSGQSDYMEYDKFSTLENTPDSFLKIKVTFNVEGKTVATEDVPFGGSVAALPEVPDKDGMHWQWDEFDNSAIYYSIVVDGEYLRPITTLASGEDESLFLAEGVFAEGQTLIAAPFEPDCAALGIKDDSVLMAYTIKVNNYDDALTVRMLTAENGALYTLDDGVLNPLSYSRDGSYVVFPLENGASIVYLVQDNTGTVALIVGLCVLGVLVAGGFVAALIKRKRGKATAATANNAAPDCTDEITQEKQRE